MNKKDRVAIVLSIPYIVFVAAVMLTDPGGLIIAIPLFAYWGYRFIKGDISFLKK
jgi:Sec-independent protein secretion pathway component TatC